MSRVQEVNEVTALAQHRALWSAENEALPKRKAVWSAESEAKNHGEISKFHICLLVIVITKAAPRSLLFLLIENNNIERYCMN